MNTRARAGLVAGLIAAVVAVAGSVGYAAVASRGSGDATHGASGAGSMMSGTEKGYGSMMNGSRAGSGAMMGAGSMMGSGMGHLWLAGDGAAVASIAQARSRAARAASTSGLHPGEVIWFDNGFYVELKDAAGVASTEVIVDPTTGAVTTEPGPAMMWNTRYGMDGGSRSSATTVSESRAKQLAQSWLDANRPGEDVASVDAYPGYWTVDVARAGRLTGMLSVNATTGQVWFHSWHGTFIDREDS